MLFLSCIFVTLNLVKVQSYFAHILCSGSKVIHIKKIMLTSAEHEILDTPQNKKYQEIQHVSGSDKPRMLFFLLINVKMPAIVGILTFMSRKNFMLS